MKKLAQISETVNARRPGSQLWLIAAVRMGILGAWETAEKTSFNDLPLSALARSFRSQAKVGKHDFSLSSSQKLRADLAECVLKSAIFLRARKNYKNSYALEWSHSGHRSSVSGSQSCLQ